MERSASPLEVLSLAKLTNFQASRLLRVPQSHLPYRPSPRPRRPLPPLHLKPWPKKRKSSDIWAICGLPLRQERSPGPILPRQRSDALFYKPLPQHRCANSIDFAALNHSLLLDKRADSSFFREYSQEPKEHISVYLPVRRKN